MVPPPPPLLGGEIGDGEREKGRGRRKRSEGKKREGKVTGTRNWGDRRAYESNRVCLRVFRRSLDIVEVEVEVDVRVGVGDEVPEGPEARRRS